MFSNQAETLLSIKFNSLTRFGVIHNKFGKNRIVRSPTVFRTMWINFVILQIKILRVGLSETISAVRRTFRLHTCDEIHDIHNCRDRNRLSCGITEDFIDLIMQVFKRCTTTGNSTKSCNRHTCFSDV